MPCMCDILNMFMPLTLYVFVACFSCTIYDPLFMHVYPCMWLITWLLIYLYTIFVNILVCGYNMLYFIYACLPLYVVDIMLSFVLLGSFLHLVFVCLFVFACDGQSTQKVFKRQTERQICRQWQLQDFFLEGSIMVEPGICWWGIDE